MAQTLLLGLGGTGSDIVNYVANDLKKKRISVNDGQICCAVLDTNDNDREKLLASGSYIPVVGTSKNRTIADYISMYANRGVRSWMPISPPVLKESMKDGASQMRPKSRLAFMDSALDNTLHELEMHIDKLFNNRDNAKIRVMLVSSLAGGTGSGMFIQTALWIRKYFAQKRCPITIRGIFLLPDVFISTIKDIRKDNTEIQSLYANAYGAIRELNAITKIKTKGMHPLLPIKLDDLFDSEKGQPDGQPVFDYAFFVDNVAEGGSVLTDIEQYKQVVARLVYMQLYAPMHDDMYSEEDNLFKRFQKSGEPVFGSCGTAKALYPTEDVLRYCALRAAQDSLSIGWRRIDEEIKEKKRKEDEREKNGTILTKRINPRHEYVRLFEDKAGRTGNQIGKDRLFVNISKDVKNEKSVRGQDDMVEIHYTDKVDDFIDRLDEIIAVKIDTADPGSLSGIKLNGIWVDQTTDTVSQLKDTVARKKRAVEGFLDAMDENLQDLTDEVLNLVLSSDMGDVNPENTASVFGFLTKKDKDNQTYFIHPIAVRYLLYRLAARLDEIKDAIITEDARDCAEKGYGDGKPKISFDNPKTHRVVEEDALAYLKSKTRMQNEERFIKTFKIQYAQHNAGQAELCRAYAIKALQYQVAVDLSQRLEVLTKAVESFFASLVKVSNSLEDAISANVRKNAQPERKIIYVCASEEEKEALYESLRFETGESNAEINGILAYALYGSYCVKESPEAENNQKYAGESVEKLFFNQAILTYSKLILERNKKDIDLDIYTAICKSADIEYDEEQAAIEKEKRESLRLDIDLETGEALDAETRHQRHIRALDDMVRRLRDLGAPFLISDNELPEDSDEHLVDIPADTDHVSDVFTPIKKRKTFWGFNPTVAEQCPELGTILGVDIRKQQNKAYGKNELDCYRAVYGIAAKYIEKFNELKGGEYYRNYSQVVREMVASGQPEDLIHTPHLDKTWHLFLPYVTPEKQTLEDARFYRLFWLALAYGMLSLDSDGTYQLARLRTISTGSYSKNEPVMYNGKAIGKVDVLQLLAALKIDGAFMHEAASLEKKFENECESLDNYEGTEFLRGRVIKEVKKTADGETVKTTVGGMASKQDNNAVTMIVRYHNSPKHDDDVTAMMIQSLEKLCSELVAGKYESSEEEKIRYKGYELCKRIYTASAMKDKDIDLLAHWKAAWAKPGFDD